MTTATRSRPSAPTPTRGGADRRVSALTAELARHLPPPGDLSVPAPARAAHLAARRSSLPVGHAMVVVARNEDEAHRLADDLAAWLPTGSVRVLPERAAMPLERALPEHDESAERLRVLAWLASQPRSAVLVAPLVALVQRTLTVGAAGRAARGGSRRGSASTRTPCWVRWWRRATTSRSRSAASASSPPAAASSTSGRRAPANRCGSTCLATRSSRSAPSIRSPRPRAAAWRRSRCCRPANSCPPRAGARCRSGRRGT